MFAYARPESLAETFELLRDAPQARVLCGGTDLIVGLRKGKFHAPLVIDIKRVAELESGIERRASSVRIGATTVLTSLIEDDLIGHDFPALVEAASVVGSIQIRNRATLAGNICNASPAADTVPPLLVYGAVVELASSARHASRLPRRVPHRPRPDRSRIRRDCQRHRAAVADRAPRFIVRAHDAEARRRPGNREPGVHGFRIRHHDLRVRRGRPPRVPGLGRDRRPGGSELRTRRARGDHRPPHVAGDTDLERAGQPRVPRSDAPGAEPARARPRAGRPGRRPA